MNDSILHHLMEEIRDALDSGYFSAWKRNKLDALKETEETGGIQDN